jgi:hypothetical protein
MEKKYEVVITVIGDGSPKKAEELIANVVEKIKVVGEASLGNLQASVTITEKQ